MAKVVVDFFTGEMPKIADTKLKDPQASYSLDARVSGGQVEALYGHENQLTLSVSSLLTLMEYIRNSGADKDWYFSSQDLDFVNSPLANDTEDRVFFGGYLNSVDDLMNFSHPNKGKKELRVWSKSNDSSPWDGDTDYYVLGMIAPQQAPIVEEDPLAGGTGRGDSSDDFSYVYTYVNSFGEESAPSSPSAVATLDPANFIRIWFQPPFGLGTNDANMYQDALGSDENIWGYGNVTKINYYRTEAGVTSTDFLYAAQLTIADLENNVSPDGNNTLTVNSYNNSTGVITVNEAITAGNIVPERHYVYDTANGTYYRITAVSLGGGAGTDTITIGDSKPTSITTGAGAISIIEWYYDDDVLSANLSDAIDSTSYYPPPDDLDGLTSMSDGRLYGWKDNMVFYSDPYQPHAWPTTNVKSFDEEIVVCRGFGNIMAIATEGYPYMCQGQRPATWSKMKIGMLEPCVSKRSTVQVSGGILYPSRNGLISLTMNGVDNVTKNIVSKKQWVSYSIENACADIANNKYMCFPNNETIRGFQIDFTDQVFQQLNTAAQAIYVAPDTGKVYHISEDAAGVDSIKEYEGNTDTYRTFTWKSKRFHLPRMVSMAVARIRLDTEFYNDLVSDIEDDAVLEAANAALFANDYITNSVTSLETYAYDSYVSGTGVVTLTDNIPAGEIVADYHRAYDTVTGISYNIGAVSLGAGTGSCTITLDSPPATLTNPIKIFAPKDLESTYNGGSFLNTSKTEFGTEGNTYNAHPFNGDVLYSLSSLGISASITFKLWADGTVIEERTIDDNKPFKLGKGVKGTEFQFQISGVVPIEEVGIATTLKELLQ